MSLSSKTAPVGGIDVVGDARPATVANRDLLVASWFVHREVVTTTVPPTAIVGVTDGRSSVFLPLDRRCITLWADVDPCTSTVATNVVITWSEPRGGSGVLILFFDSTGASPPSGCMVVVLLSYHSFGNGCRLFVLGCGYFTTMWEVYVVPLFNMGGGSYLFVWGAAWGLIGFTCV